MELVEFLLARIAEDEAASRPGPEPESWCDRGEGVHYEHARVLADCEAKREAVARWAALDAIARAASRRRDEDEARDARNTRYGVQLALEALALPYADHPDYDEAWRP